MDEVSEQQNLGHGSSCTAVLEDEIGRLDWSHILKGKIKVWGDKA